MHELTELSLKMPIWTIIKDGKMTNHHSNKHINIDDKLHAMLLAAPHVNFLKDPICESEVQNRILILELMDRGYFIPTCGITYEQDYLFFRDE